MNFYARILFILFGCIAAKLHAQGVNPWSSQFALPELTAFLNFDEPIDNIEQLLEEERIGQAALKALVYAVGIQTLITPQTSGQWDTIPAKGYVWRLGIQADNALSLNLFIEKYLMQPGMALYAYNKSMSNLAGPFDARNNANGGVLPIQSLPGDMIIVEWNIPLQTPQRNDFTITSVGYGFRDISGYGRKIALAADDCNVDVNCLTGNHWQREIRAVVLMETILSNGRTQYCTGALVNQAVDAIHKKPYILTANHCIETDALAKSTTFIFGYEKAFCDDGIPMKPSGIAGSSLVASYRELDFTLLELPENRLSEVTHQPFYAGWTVSTVAPQGVVGIHHPQGDIKKISTATNTLVSRTFEDAEANLKCDENAHWLVTRWNEGVTEGGSSGSPLFDNEHKIVGTLSGGYARCSNPVNDYYSKFSEQWNKYPEKEKSLMQWLDPDNKGVTSLWGYDPLTGYEGRYEMTGNIGKNENETLLKTGEWGYLTSNNSRQWVSFAEKIKNDSIANIIGMEVHVAKVSEPAVDVRFAVWRGNDFPITLLESKNVRVTSEYINYKMHVFFENMIEDIEGDFFIGYILDNTSPLDTFAVYHSPLRPYSGISGMYAEDKNGIWMSLEEDTPPIYTSMDVRAIGRFAKQKQPYQLPQKQELKIILQESNNIALLLFDIDQPFASLHSATIECYDISGKRLLYINEVNGFMNLYGEKTYMQVELDVSSLPPGIYIINMFDKNKKQSGKFLKLHYQ